MWKNSACRSVTGEESRGPGSQERWDTFGDHCRRETRLRDVGRGGRRRVIGFTQLPVSRPSAFQSSFTDVVSDANLFNMSDALLRVRRYSEAEEAASNAVEALERRGSGQTHGNSPNSPGHASYLVMCATNLAVAQQRLV